MERLETLIRANTRLPWSDLEICHAVSVSARALRVWCAAQFGMGAAEYVQLRRAQLARRELPRLPQRSDA